MARIKTWTEIKGDGAQLVLDRQHEMRSNGSSKKNLGLVIDILMNELAASKKKK